MGRRRRRATRVERRLWAAAAGVFGVWWAWQTHPAAVVVTLAVAGPVAVLGWRARLAWRMRAGQATDLYRHYFADWVPASQPQVYYGITGRYGLRCAQHAESSWWYTLIDPAKSTCQTWPNRAAAEAAEAAAIRADCPIGNERGNLRYLEQQAERRQLQALAAEIRWQQAAAIGGV
jgi:hypothetical protein